MKPFKAFISGLVIGVLVFANIQLYYLKPEPVQSEKLTHIIDTLKDEYYKDFDESAFTEYMYEAGLTFFATDKNYEDPYTVYFPSDDYLRYKESLSDKYVGIGLTLKDLIVQGTFPGSPAEKAGLIKGDLLKTFNGEKIDNDDDFVSRVKESPTEDSFKVGVLRNGEEMTFTLKKEEIKIENVHVEPVDDEIAVPEEIGYISMDQFSTNSYKDLKAQLEGSYKDKKGIVLDLRNNPGGYLGEAEKIGMYLLEENEVIYYESTKEEMKEITGVGEGYNKPIIVLLNQYSASASELLASALRDNGRAVIVGTPSYGKGVMQSSVQFEDGSGLKYTSALWLTPKKENINKIGVKPDYEVINYDDQLEKAFDLLLEGLDE